MNNVNLFMADDAVFHPQIFAPQEHNPNKQKKILPRDKCLRDLKDLYTHDFLCQRKKVWELVPLEGMEKINAFVNVIKNIDLAKELCSMYPDELFFAGGIISYIKFSIDVHQDYCPDIDFFLVCNSEARAIQIIQECVAYLTKISEENDCFSILIRSENALTFMNSPSSACDDHPAYCFSENKLQFQFIHRLYSHYSQIPGMFDLGPCQLIYSHKKGYEATRMGAYCVRNKVQFLDPTKRSTTFLKRIEKYIRRGFDLIIPNTHTEMKVTSQTVSRYGHLNAEVSRTYQMYSLINECSIEDAPKYPGHSVPGSNWEVKEGYLSSDYQEKMEYENDLIKPLYFNVPITTGMPMLVNMGNPDWPVDVEGLLLISKNYKSLYPLDPSLLCIKSIKKLLNTEQEVYEFSQRCIFADEAKENFQAWGKQKALARQKELETFLPPYGQGGFFRISNPGQQGGGSFHPTVMSGADYWKKEACFPIFVGLSHETYWLIKQAWIKYTSHKAAPVDLFKMICFMSIG